VSRWSSLSQRYQRPVWAIGGALVALAVGLGRFSPTAHTSEVLAAYQTDNLLDSSHFPFLHGSLSSRNPLNSSHEVVDQHELGFSTVLRKLGDDDASTEGWLRYTLVAPFTARTRTGRRVLSPAIVAGLAAENIIPSATWYPAANGTRDGITHAVSSVVTKMVVDVFREFVSLKKKPHIG
jgi:hypothetical protein